MTIIARQKSIMNQFDKTLFNDDKELFFPFFKGQFD